MMDGGVAAYALRITSLGDGTFRAVAQESLRGEATHTFALPSSPVGPDGSPLLTDVAEIAAAGPEAAAAFGIWLRDLVFAGELAAHLKTNLALADQRRLTLQLQLWLSEAGELATWPWEYLYYPGREDPWGVGPGAPTLVRCLDLDRDVPALAARPPLKILVVVSEPSDLDPIEGVREWTGIWDAVTESLGKEGLVSLELLQPPTVDALQRRLLQNDVHVLHFVGHGDLDPKSRLGRLYLEDEERGKRQLTSGLLRAVLGNRSMLRLVVLSSCEGASAVSGALLGGLAQSVAQAGVPAVVAMQAQIWTRAATRFTSFFYSALANGQPIDAAVGEARRSLYVDELAEWGIPVLYTRTPNCRILDRAAIDAMPERERYEAHLKAWYGLARQSLTDHRLEEARTWLDRLPGNWGGAAELRREVDRLRSAADDDLPATRLAASPTLDAYYWLVQEILEGRVVPFLGWRANLCGRPDITRYRPGLDPPSGTELATELAKAFGYPGAFPEDLARVTQFILLFHGRPDLYRKLRGLYPADVRPTPLHDFLAALPTMVQARSATPALPLIVTVNYDDLLERAFEAAGHEYDVVHFLPGQESGAPEHPLGWWHKPWRQEPRPIEPPDAYVGLQLGKRTTIVRLVGITEGLAGTRDGCLITEDDHLRQLARDRQLPKIIGQYLAGKRFLFLGYDLCNWEQRVIVRRVLGEQEAPSPPWVVGGDADGLDPKLWEEFKALHLAGSFEAFADTLQSRLEAVR